MSLGPRGVPAKVQCLLLSRGYSLDLSGGCPLPVLGPWPCPKPVWASEPCPYGWVCRVPVLPQLLLAAETLQEFFPVRGEGAAFASGEGRGGMAVGLGPGLYGLQETVALGEGRVRSLRTLLKISYKDFQVYREACRSTGQSSCLPTPASLSWSVAAAMWQGAGLRGCQLYVSFPSVNTSPGQPDGRQGRCEPPCLSVSLALFMGQRMGGAWPCPWPVRPAACGPARPAHPCLPEQPRQHAYFLLAARGECRVHRVSTDPFP